MFNNNHKFNKDSQSRINMDNNNNNNNLDNNMDNNNLVNNFDNNIEQTKNHYYFI